MTKDIIMGLVGAYVQEVKDFGYIDDSKAYEELSAAVFQMIDNLNKLNLDNLNNL